MPLHAVGVCAPSGQYPPAPATHGTRVCIPLAFGAPQAYPLLQEPSYQFTELPPRPAGKKGALLQAKPGGHESKGPPAHDAATAQSKPAGQKVIGRVCGEGEGVLLRSSCGRAAAPKNARAF